MESTLVPARKALPVAPYIGGKRNLADRIIQRIAKTPHQRYAEVFVGMAGVFLRRPFRAPNGEVINDISADVVTLFRILQRHYVPFLEMLRWQLTTRADFERLMATDPDTLTDLERAARFLYLQRTAFGGKVSGRTFGVSMGPARFNITKLVPLLEAAHERLADVTIERLPWSGFLDRYDRPGTLFYLDPPYWGCESDYGKAIFAQEDFTRLSEQLAGLKGRFLMSLNDTPEVRQIFGRFALESVRTTYTIPGNQAVAGGAAELLISGPGRRRRL